MNARQKAKRYKQLYEELSKQPLDTLRYEQTYPGELIANTCFMKEDGNLMIIDKEAKEEIDFIQPKKLYTTAYILKDIAQGLAEGLNKYIVYRMNYDPTTNTCRVCGEIKVVNR